MADPAVESLVERLTKMADEAIAVESYRGHETIGWHLWGDDCQSALREAASRLSSPDLEEMQELVDKLKRGDCWCEVGIGHPCFKEHTATCLELQRRRSAPGQEKS